MWIMWITYANLIITRDAEWEKVFITFVGMWMDIFKKVTLPEEIFCKMKTAEEKFFPPRS